MRAYWIILTCLFCLGSALGQNVLYVSDSGNDANPGTVNAPFRTIQHCVDQWDGSNQYTCACAGEFNEEVVISAGGPDSAQRNQIIAWDTDNDGDRSDEYFHLNGQNSRNIALRTALGAKPDNIELAYITFRNYIADGGCAAGGKMHFIEILCPGGSGCTDWKIHHCDFDSLGIGCPGLESYIALRPTNAPRLQVYKNRFANIGGFVMRYIDGADIVFRDNLVNIEVTGLKGWGENLDHMIIENNIFQCDGNGNWNDTAACLGSNAVNFSNNAQFCIIRNNEFIDCLNSISFGSSSGFGHRDNKGHLVEGNIIYRSERSCNRYSAPIQIADCSGPSVHTGDSIEVRDITFRNNIIHYYGMPDWYNQGPAVQITTGHYHSFQNQLRFYNNSISGFRWGLRLDACLLPSSGSQDSAYYQLDGLSLHNNIFAGIRESQITLNTDGHWPDNRVPANFSSDHNIFEGANLFEWQQNRTLSDWQSAGYDLNSHACLPHFSDSLLLKLAQADTCARQRGISLSGFNSDFEGDSRPMGSWDIGADQYADSGIGFPESTLPQLSVFPNPFQNNLKIQTDLLGWQTLTIYAAAGQLIYRGEFKGELSLSTKSWERGLYIVHVVEGDTRATWRKILKY